MISLCLLFIAGAAAAPTYPMLTPVPVDDPALCKSGYFPDENNPCKYFQCIPNGRDNYEAFERWCWDQTAFDADSCVCISSAPDGANCSEENDHFHPEPCDPQDEDRCCQPCNSYNPLDCATGPHGTPYTKTGETTYEFCNMSHECPQDDTDTVYLFNVTSCCCDTVPCNTVCQSWSFQGDCLSIDNNVENTLMECDGRGCDFANGLACDFPADYSGFIKAWYGRQWYFKYDTSDGTADDFINNGDGDNPFTVELGSNAATFRDVREGAVFASVTVSCSGGGGVHEVFSDGAQVTCDGTSVDLPRDFQFVGTKCPLHVATEAGITLATFEICPKQI